MKFNYYEPTSINECIEMLIYYSPNACLLAGGTDIVVKLRHHTIRPRAVISLQSLQELRKLERKNDGSLEIGAMKTLREIEKSNVLADGFDIIRQGAGQVSSVQVRNVATLGGNSCNASPAADTVPGLIASEATVRIAGPKGERVLPLEDFFEGPGKVGLRQGEILTGFHVLRPPPLTGGVYKKYAIRGETDIAIVGVAVKLTLAEDLCLKDSRIVLGAVAPTPLRVRIAEDMLAGQHFSEAMCGEIANIASEESKAVSDQRASAQYRKEMVKVWTRHAIREAFFMASGNARCCLTNFKR